METDLGVQEQIKMLVDKAAKAEKSEDAMRFSQAACNVANAMACVRQISKQP